MTDLLQQQKKGEITLGIEEEFFLVDPSSRDLLADLDPGIFKTCDENRGPHKEVREILRSQIETNTRVWMRRRGRVTLQPGAGHRHTAVLPGLDASAGIVTLINGHAAPQTLRASECADGVVTVTEIGGDRTSLFPVSFFRVRDGRIAAVEAYFADNGPPPFDRSAWTESY